MNFDLKIVALHFEPTEQINTYFVDLSGKPLIEPDWEIEVSAQQADTLTSMVVNFPSELSYGWMCAPVFRDVLIWKEATGRVTRIFQLCFECDQYLLLDSTKKCVLIENSSNDPFAESVKAFREAFDVFDREVNLTFLSSATGST